ncbi:MAG TPA: SPOCS domain-containing protein [Terriglobales bacterium]|nr:SPOCS domain-containing protein [Terriglobales bacterium]
METVSTAKLEYNVTLFSESKEIDSSAETSLPEYLPDIHRVVRVDARPTMTGTTSEEGMVAVEGWVDCVIMYLPREGSLQSHFCRVPFTLRENDTRITPKVRISATVSMTSVTCRPLSERKLSVACKVRAILQGEESRGAEVVKPSEADRAAAEFLTSELGAARFVGRTSKDFTIEEMLELPGGSPHIERMLRCDVSLATSEYKVVTNRVVIKGEAYVICLYLSDVESGRVEQYTTTIPFNEVLDVEGAREGDIAAINYSILDIVYGVMADAAGEDRRLSLRIDAQVTASVYTRVNLPIIRDTYSTSRQVKTVSANLDTEVYQEYKCGAKVADTVSLGGKTSDIFAVEAYADVKGTAVEDGVPIFKGDLQISFLTKDEEGGLQAIDRCVKFSSKCGPLDQLPDRGIIFSGSCTIDDFDWRVSVSGEISVTAAISCCGIGRIKAPVTTVTSMEMGDKAEKKKSAAAITLYYPTQGETLWDVGKRYLVSQGAICAANQIENGEIAAFSPLIIPR